MQVNLGKWVLGWESQWDLQKVLEELFMSYRQQGLHIFPVQNRTVSIPISIYQLSFWPLTSIYRCLQRQTVTFSHAASKMKQQQLSSSCTELMCWSLVQFDVVSAKTSLFISAISPGCHLYLPLLWVLIPLSTSSPLHRLPTQVYDYECTSAQALGLVCLKDMERVWRWSEKGISNGYWLG